MINEDRIVKEFMKYVQIASPSKKEKEFADFIKGELEALGLDVYIDNSGEAAGSNTGNIIARLSGNAEKPPILFSCHLDTVTPAIGIKPIIKDGVIYSDGTTILGADDKAGIAAVIEALKAVKENNIEHGLIEVVFSICEEIGLVGSKNLEYEKIQSNRAFVLDSGGEPGEIVVQGPAQDNIEAKIIGRAAHAGVAPEEGISAIKIAANAISKMNLFRIDEETTANIGVIHGGEATNIITPEVKIYGEARSLNEDKLNKQSNHMSNCIEEIVKEFGGKVEIKVKREYNAFKVEENMDIVELMKKACSNLELNFHIETSGGGSDTNIFNENGIRAVNIATGERKPHTLEEYVVIKDLVNTAKLVLEMIKLA
jgi:tripeptide aminopeptidase